MPTLALISPDALLRQVVHEQPELKGPEHPTLGEAMKAWQGAPPKFIILDSAALDGRTSELATAITNALEPVYLFVLGAPPETLDSSLITETFPKPLRLNHVLSRVNFYFRMTERNRAPVLTLGPWRFEPRRCQLTALVTSESVKLTDKESRLLEYLCQSPALIPREELLASVWGYEEGIETHTLETHIYRLRRKLGSREGDAEGEGIFIAENGAYGLNPRWLRP